MAIVVPFGQYIPGSSRVHTIDARMKLLLMVGFIFALFASGWVGLLVCAALLIAAYVLAKIPLKRAARGLKPVLFILAFTFLFNAFTFAAADADNITYDTVTLFGTEYLIPHTVSLIKNFGVVPPGVVRGLYFALRITLLVSITSLLTFTSSIVSLTDALTSILRPLRLVRVPVEDVAMMFTIALRFIPLTTEEVEKIMVAQTARGANFSKGGLIKRARALVPVMVPLFVNLFKRADDLAAAMEGRCYQGAGRTTLNETKLRPSDLVIALIGTALLITLGIFV